MPNLVSISNTEHKDLKVDPNQTLAQHASTHLIPVVIDEFSRLSAQYPIVLVKHEETGRFICAALMGLNDGENLFIDGNELNSFCLPLNLTRQPFFLGLSDTGDEDDMVVCVDIDHPCVNMNDGDRLFDDAGEQTSLLQHSCSILDRRLIYC